MNDGSENIPLGWQTPRLDEACEFFSGYGFPLHLQGNAEGELPFFKVGDISEAWKSGELSLRTARHYLTKDAAHGIHAKPLPSGTTVFAKIGAAIALNRRAILAQPSLVDNNVMGLHPLGGIDNKYLFYFSCTLRLEALARATTLPSLRKGDVGGIRIPLAPIPEQKRIVFEMEKQLTDLDAGVAALKRVQANLKRYRASVLKAACEGRLVPTEAELARDEGRDYEPADKLLERILKERRAKWEADQFAKMKAAGKAPRDDRWKAKYEEPTSPIVPNAQGLPEGWVWSSLVQLAALKGGITKGPTRGDGTKLRAVPYLRVANVQRGYLDLDEVKDILATDDELCELRLLPGDVLFNEGGDRDKLGRGWIWNGEIPDCIHQNHVFRARLYLSDVVPKYVSWYGNSQGQRYFLEQGKQTTNLASINLTKLGCLPVPLPPAAEQQRIASEVERILSVVDDRVRSLDHLFIRAERLRQSILKRAFEGKLVPQDPNDEPASVLLERIRQERATPSIKPIPGQLSLDLDKQKKPRAPRRRSTAT